MDYILLQIVSPLIFFTFILYPRYVRNLQLNEFLGLALELINIFDIMDIVSDLKFINNYGRGWHGIYYMSVGIGILLITFPIEINTDDLVWTDQPKVKQTSETANLLDKDGCTKSKFVSSDYGSLDKASRTNPQLTEDEDSMNFRASKKVFKLNEKLVEDI